VLRGETVQPMEMGAALAETPGHSDCLPQFFTRKGARAAPVDLAEGKGAGDAESPQSMFGVFLRGKIESVTGKKVDKMRAFR